MYFIRSWRNFRPVWLSLDIRFDLKSLSSSEPPNGQSTRMKLSADCVSPRSDCSAKPYCFLAGSVSLGA